MASTDLTIEAAHGAVILVTLVNTCAKTLLVAVIGGRSIAAKIAWPFAMAVIAGILWQWRCGG